MVTLTNRGGIADNLFISVTLPSGVALDPNSVVPPASSISNRWLMIRPSANTQLEWRMATLPADGVFQVSFAVVVQEAIPLNVVVQGGQVGSPATVNSTVSHTIVPTGDDEHNEPGKGGVIYLPFVQR